MEIHTGKKYALTTTSDFISKDVVLALLENGASFKYEPLPDGVHEVVFKGERYNTVLIALAGRSNFMILEEK